MASSLLRLVARRAAARSAGWNSMVGCGSRISTVRASDDRIHRPYSTSPSRTSPWLMLPPAFEGGDTFYKFYSIADNKVLSLCKRGGGCGCGGELPIDNCKFVGSSHGWLVLFNPRNCDLFLSNPLSRRHIKLPPIHNLPIPEGNLRHGFGCVSKVIISCSPDEDEEHCRAMMRFGPESRLAFCWPGRSTEWTPIGEPLFKCDYDGRMTARSYEEFVYSSRQKLFFCVTKYAEFESWDLRDHRSPALIPMNDIYVDDDKYPWAARSEEEMELKKLCRDLKFWVVNEDNNDLFLVIRHVLEFVDRAGSYVEYNPEDRHSSEQVLFENCFPYKTIGFDVHKYDPKEKELKYMDGSLDGLVFFIGYNHAFSLPAAEFPELKPNSIYFTDIVDLIPNGRTEYGCLYGGHDLGIFDYKNGTFSTCYYPCDVQSIKRIEPAPMWFTPNPLLLV